MDVRPQGQQARHLQPLRIRRLFTVKHGGPKISTAVLSGLSELLAVCSVDLDRVLRKLDINPGEFNDPEGHISMQDWIDLFESLVRETGDTDFGLHVGETLQPKVNYVILYAMRSAPDLGTALATFARFSRTVVSLDVEFTEGAANAKLDAIYPPSVSRLRQISGFGAARMLGHIRMAAGPDWKPVAIEFPHRRPDDVGEYERLFGDNVSFGHSRKSISIDAQTLALPMPHADPSLYAIVTRHCEQLLQDTKREEDPLHRVREYIVERLADNTPSLEGAADHLGLSPGKLRVTLKDFGTTFRDLFDSTRRGLAQKYLIDTDIRLSEIAFLLGFSEQSAFTRASKRWFGVPPRQYRKRPG